MHHSSVCTTAAAPQSGRVAIEHVKVNQSQGGSQATNKELIQLNSLSLITYCSSSMITSDSHSNSFDLHVNCIMVRVHTNHVANNGRAYVDLT
jgi:hypothetical protein